VAGWTCNGIPKDGQQHPEQHTPGKHEPYENFGKDCVICGLSKEANTSGSTPPVKTIALALTALVLAALGGIAYLFIPKPCPTGQQRVGGSCQAIAPSPSPTLTPIASSTPTLSPAATPTSTLIPATTTTLYRTFAEVPNVPSMKVRYGGSTSFAPLRSLQIVNRILQAHPGFELVYTEPPMGGKPGSGSGIAMLLDSQISVAQSSRPLKPEEFQAARTGGFELEQQAVAIDGIALYVNPSLSIPGLTADQIKGIYTGKITNWRDVGGPDLKIIPLSRNPKDGGTPEFFRDHVLAGEDFAPSVEPYVRDTTESLRQVARTSGGIGYATASEVCNQDTIHPLPISGTTQNFVSPCNGRQVNQAAIADNSYPFTRRLFVIIRRDGSLDEQAGVAYVNLLLSDEGQQIVKESGLVPIR
jgi:phosphate transport system substrate-binding protein